MGHSFNLLKAQDINVAAGAAKRESPVIVDVFNTLTTDVVGPILLGRAYQCCFEFESVKSDDKLKGKGWDHWCQVTSQEVVDDAAGDVMEDDSDDLDIAWESGDEFEPDEDNEQVWMDRYGGADRYGE